jgi:hypothetical protein
VLLCARVSVGGGGAAESEGVDPGRRLLRYVAQYGLAQARLPQPLCNCTSQTRRREGWVCFKATREINLSVGISAERTCKA